MDQISRERSLFQIPDDVAYFNVAGISPLLRTALQHGQDGLSLKSSPWLINQDIFFDRTETARSLFAQLISSSPDHIAIVPSATYGVELAIKNLKLMPDDEVLVQAEEFPALILPLIRACKNANAKLVTVPRPSDSNWTHAICEKIRNKTRVVAFCPSHWTDGTVAHAETIANKARSMGSEVWVDGCQSLGAVPFDLPSVQPDYLFAPTYKWLLGPYTYGFMYVAPHKQESEPLEEYWANRWGSEDFASLTQYEPRYRAGARRFDMSERSQFINTPVAIEALGTLLKWEPENIAKKLFEVTTEIAQAAQKKGYVVAPAEFRSPHFLGLRKPEGFSLEFKNRLQEKNVYVGYRGDSMRISPHLYNNGNDLDRLISVL